MSSGNALDFLRMLNVLGQKHRSKAVSSLIEDVEKVDSRRTVPR